MKANFLSYIIAIQILFSLELSVLTYNIHALSPVFAGDKPKIRIIDILDRSRDFDVILLQENWIFPQERIMKTLNDYQVSVSNESKFKGLFKWLLNPNGSGLSFAIKNNQTILSSNQEVFENCSGWLGKMNDCLSTKGFQQISIKIDNGRVDIYNTHLDAGDSKKDINTRNKQIQNLIDYIKLNSSDQALIIAGDININLLDNRGKEIINNFIDKLNLKMLNWSINHLENNIMEDYIFYRSSNVMKISLLSSGVDENLLGLSDHPPIKGLFDIRKK